MIDGSPKPTPAAELIVEALPEYRELFVDLAEKLLKTGRGEGG